ncbi:MAG: glutathione S-transferase N-terminal domain-containing protein [Polymorphobacter sp.]
MGEPLILMGVPGSPYTRKMLAVLRYRRIAYRLLMGGPGGPPGTHPRPKVPLLPTFFLPDADGVQQAVTDSTPLIRRFEREFPDRPVVPADPALAFIDALLEDYGDEWLTKAMFHYRWNYAPDIDRAGEILPRWTGMDRSEAELAAMKAVISARQISRLYVVGSNAVTGPVIEASYARFLTLFAQHLEAQRYLLGARPGAGDFAFFGQLTALTHFDPTPMALTLATAPRVYTWVDIVEDLSGLEPGDWLDLGAPQPTLKALLGEIGRTYVPVLLANGAALAAQAADFETQVDGQRWAQPTFPYHGKCLMALRAQHAALPADARASVDALLAGTGCERLFT